jgi:hypothetical protein
MRLLAILGILLLFGCNSYIRNASDDCKKYFTFIEQNWLVIDSERLIYGFKGNPEYWKNDSYIQSDCFLGLERNQINNLLGTPSKEFIFYDVEIVFYCFNEGCLKSPSNGISELVVNYDKNNKVILAYFNPSGVDTDH